MMARTGRQLLFLSIFLFILFFYCELIGIKGFIPGMALGSALILLADALNYF